MRSHIIRIWVCCCMVLFVILQNVNLYSQIPQEFEVATWKDFKKAAITYTFDDNTPNQLALIVPMFDEYQFPTTLYTVMNWGPNWSGLEAAAQNGHEIGSHTVSHPSLSGLSVGAQETQLAQSQMLINENVPSGNCVTIAYPNCVVGDVPTIEKYYIAGRICSGQIIPSSPSDFYRLSSIIAGNQGVNSASGYDARANSALNSGGWAVFLFHAIDNESGYSPASSADIRTHLDNIKTNEADFWVGTFASVVKYIKERDALSITENSINNDSIEIILTDNLDDALYNEPVTLKRAVPNDWANVSVFIEGKVAKSKIVEDGGSQYVVFEAIPDQGSIYLSNSLNTTGNKNELITIDVQLSPNPFNSELVINIEGEFEYSIYSLDGKKLINGKGINTKNVGNSLSTGTYILNIKTEEGSTSKKIIKN